MQVSENAGHHCYADIICDCYSELHSVIEDIMDMLLKCFQRVDDILTMYITYI
jgi:hypothetical protein